MKNILKPVVIFSVLLTITACGGGGGGGPAFSITANSQSFSTNEDEIYIGNLSASTSSASTVTFQKISGPSFGAINLSQDGNFTYNPQAEFSGNDSFQFTATAVENSTVSKPATVSITIIDVNDSPVVQLTNPPEAWAGNSDILMPENATFEFTVDDPDNEFSQISYTASIGDEILPSPSISTSESGTNTMTLDFSGITSAGFKEVTIFANDGNSQGESSF